MDLVNDECGGLVGDLDEASVVEVDTRLAPGDGRCGTASDVGVESEGATST